MDATRVIALPNKISNGIQPVIKFDNKHPTNKPGIASIKSSGKSVNASDNLTCIAPLAIGAVIKDVIAYNPAIIPALASFLLAFSCFTLIKKSLSDYKPKKDLKTILPLLNGIFFGCFIEVFSENLLDFIIHLFFLFCK